MSQTSKKKTAYKPDAIDADGDGIVQEGTEFERPAGTYLDPEECCQDACDACPISDALEGTVETTTLPVEGNVWVADETVSYAVLAARFLPDGWKKHDYAVHLYTINKGKPVHAGTEVKL